MKSNILPFSSGENIFFSELLACLLTFIAFALILVCSELCNRFKKAPVEFCRKFVHLSSGIIISLFPWIFSSLWSPIFLGAVSCTAIYISHKLQLLKSIQNAERKSYSDFYYIIATFGLFAISKKFPVFYMISILTLSVADVLAALLGKTYQQISYNVEQHKKSLEGSLVFFIIAFLIIHLPLLLMTELDRPLCVLIAFQTAIVVTSLEAICLNGLDNLVVPFSVFFLLVKLSENSLETVSYYLGIHGIIILLVAISALRYKILSFSLAILLHLFLLTAYALGGLYWIYTPLLSISLFLTGFYSLSSFSQEEQQPYQVLAFFYMSLIPFICIFLDNAFNTFPFLYPFFLFSKGHFFYYVFVGVSIAQLSIALFKVNYKSSSSHYLNLKKKSLSTFSLINLSCFFFIAPFAIWITVTRFFFSYLLLCLSISFLSSLIFYLGFEKKRFSKPFPWEFRYQTLSVATALLLLLPIFIMLLINSPPQIHIHP